MKTELATITEHAPPYWYQRAWTPREHQDTWALDALKDGFETALEVWIQMEERDPDMAKPYGRTRAFAIDYTLTGQPSGDPERVSVWARECLDAFHQDVINNVSDAGLWDKETSRRWSEAAAETRQLTARWLHD